MDPRRTPRTRTRLAATALALFTAAAGGCASRAPAAAVRRSAPRATGAPALPVTLVTDGEQAHDATPLDEARSSAFWTERGALEPAQVRDGACAGVSAPRPPYVLRARKREGATRGFLVRDARGVDYVLKLDQLPARQPELSTAADVIVSRLYWAAGYHVPCNRVARVRAEDFVAPPAVRAALAADLARATPAAGAPPGAARVSASRVVPGALLGPWSGRGVREDDPFDVVPHEHQRAARAERLLAAWVHRWDARAANALDARDPADGRVRHYMLDFGDALGVVPLDARDPAALGLRHARAPGVTLVDALTLGRVRRPWDDRAPDPVEPVLGYFTAHDFDPGAWVPSRRVARFARADARDLGWMARRLARLGPAHVRAAVAAGELTDPGLAARVTEVLLARRARALAWAFARSSPLDLLAAPRRADAVCAVDLGRAAGVDAAGVAYGAWLGGDGAPARALRVYEAGEGVVCAGLPAARVGARGATIAWERTDARGARTVLRARLRAAGADGQAPAIAWIAR